MPNPIPCPACRQSLSIDVPPGSQARCPFCNTVLEVPPDASSPPTAPPIDLSYAGLGTHQTNNGLALASMICGIVGIAGTCLWGLGVLVGIVGLVLGIVALVRINRRPERYGGRGMAIAGVCSGGTTLIIIPLAIAIMLPALSRTRELSKRTVCSANLRGIGQAMYIYASDAGGDFPFPATVKVRSSQMGQFELFNPARRVSGAGPDSLPSPTADMWEIVRSGNTTAQNFICPSTSDVPDPAMNPAAYYDFAGPQYLSYAYHYQYGGWGAIGPAADPAFPFMADANPYIKGAISAPTLQDRLSAANGNSANHTNREGQNVLFVDSHVTFDKGPDAGASGLVDPNLSLARNRDNIYTTHSPNGFVDPGVAPSPQRINPASRSDTILLP